MFLSQVLPVDLRVAAMAHRPHPCHPEGELGVAADRDSECTCAERTIQERWPRGAFTWRQAAGSDLPPEEKAALREGVEGEL